MLRTLPFTVSTILAPVDFSSGSRAAVEAATALARAFQATVTLLHVGQLPDLMNSIVPGADSVVDVRADRTRAENMLDKLRAEALRDSSVDIRAVVEYGSPVQEILSFSHSGGFDMLVMGTHGRTGLRHLLMGSVAEAVVRRALCPVLTVHLPFRDGTF